MGYKSKEDPNKVFGPTRKILEEEVRRKKEEYNRNAGLIQLQKLYEIQNNVRLFILNEFIMQLQVYGW